MIWRPRWGGRDHDVTLDAADDDWEWRRRIRSNPHAHLIYRIIVGVVGSFVVILGLILVPLPGQGWLVVLLGLVILASEFEFAQRWLQRLKHTLRVWTDWMKVQQWWVKGLVTLATFAAVAAAFWAIFLIGGVPAYLPDGAEGWLKGIPGLAH